MPARLDDPPAQALWYSHDRRIGKLEGDVQSLARCMSALQSEQHRQTELTTKIAADTADIRTMVAGAKVTGRLLAWVGSIAAAIVSIYALAQLAGRFLA